MEFASRKGAASWLRLAACVVAIMAVANLQYTWALFVVPLMKDLGVKLSAVQMAFTLYIVAQTWLAPFEGGLADRFAIRPLVIVGGLLVGVNWIGAGLARSVGPLYFACALGGFGCGMVMSACGRYALTALPGRRGLSVGLVAMAYGLGPVLALLPIQRSIAHDGYRSAFIHWGYIQVIVVMGAAAFLGGKESHPRPAAGAPGLTPFRMVRTYRFFLMYLIMILVAFGGLVLTAQLVPLAESFGVGQSALVFGVGAVTLALLLDRVMNAAARPFWGWFSDRVGRCDALAAAFACEAVAVLLLLQTAQRPLWFVLQSGLTFLAWGEIFALFPAMIADVFGPEHAMTNYGVLFTAKGIASFFAGWGAARVVEAHLPWTAVLWVALACDLLAAGLTFFCLRPLLSGSQEVAAP